MTKSSSSHAKRHPSASRRGIDKIKHFVGVALKDFSRVGGIFPSSRWTAKAVARQLRPEMRWVVEYGPGNGAVTRFLLKALLPSSHLIGIELNPEFIRSLQTVDDSRFQVVSGNVIEMSRRLQELVPEGVDAVVSGIPFSFLSPEVRETIVKNTRRALRPQGKFILYQNSPLMKALLSRYFTRVTTFLEPRNIPPYFILVGEV